MKTFKKLMKWLLGAALAIAGSNHFVNPAFYLRMMPPILPAPLALVYLSGVIEIALGLLLLLIPRAAKLAAAGIVALLIAVFPANVYMAMNPQAFPEFSAAALYLRLPLQLVLIAWAFWLAKDKIER